MSVEHLGIKTNVASKCKQTKLKFNWQQQFKSGKTQWQEWKIYVRTHETESNTQPTSLDTFDYFSIHITTCIYVPYLYVIFSHCLSNLTSFFDITQKCVSCMHHIAIKPETSQLCTLLLIHVVCRFIWQLKRISHRDGALSFVWISYHCWG